MKLKLAVLIVMVSVSSVFATHSYSQAAKVSLRMENTTLDKVMDEIERQSEFYFIFNQKQIDVSRIVNIDVENRLISDILVELFNKTNVNYAVLDRKILLSTDSLEDDLRNFQSASGLQQQTTVSGKITDGSTGESMPGVNILLKGTTLGVITDGDGNYSLSFSPTSNPILVFSFIGYVTQEIPLNGRTTLNVNLAAEVTGLEEVVVIGYGTQKKVNLTGSVDAVDGAKLSERPVANVSLALQGMSSGTTVINRGGAPGTDNTNIRIRGYGTFGNKDPLILVDGVTVSNMSNIDAQDIANISILKDAASSAIYGSRAANGVILITTKRGGSGGIKVTYSNYFGIQSLTRVPEVVKADDYMMLVNESCINANRQPKYTQEAIDKTMAGTEPYKYPNTDWWGIMYRDALQQKHSININGGTDKFKTNVTFNYLNQEGVLIKTGSNQYRLRLNNDIKLSEKLNFGTDISIASNSRWEPARISDIYWNMLHDVPATIVAKYPDGTYQLGPTNQNPLATAEQSGYNKPMSIQGILSSFFTYEIIKGLKFTGRYSIKEDLGETKTYYNNYEFRDHETQNLIKTYTSSLNDSRNRNHYTDLQGLLDYDKTFSNHYFHFLIGYSHEYNYYNSVTARRQDFYSNALQELNLGSTTGQTNSGISNEWSLLSYFGRINYTFSNKYLLEANFRYDGSSRFAEGRRWGFFPSFSLGWRLSEEGFLKDIAWLNNLKLRLSWGQLGNQDIGLYQYIQTISLGQSYSFGGALVDGAAKTSLANLNISWEKTTSSNIGIDIGILKDKLTIIADYFIRNTNDILLARDIPMTIGLNAPTQNVGAVKNTGWELATRYQDNIGKDISFRIGFNISDVKNKIIKYGNPSVSGWNVTMEGESMDSFYGWINEGFFQTTEEVAAHAFQHTITAPGDIMYKDLNNDKIINDLDKRVLGSSIPRYSYGIDLGVNYKNFDLSLFFNGVGKCNGYQYGALIEGPIWDGFTTKEMLDRWTPENTDATWPRLVYQTVHNQQASDFWIQNTSFLRFKNFQLGYTIPMALADRIKIKNLRAYVNGENLFTFTKAKNLDPEFPSGRVNYFPQTKIYSIGLDITF
jgi:TonB-linked SusC/RagA family outer membrane protein